MNERSKKGAKRTDNQKANELTEQAQRRAYLNSRGIDPSGPFQLSLQFPTLENDSLRAIPNDYARSSLFTTRHPRVPRENLEGERLFHLHEGQGIEIEYTGIELRALDDELVWMQILDYAKKVPLGNPFEFSIIDLVRDVDWKKNGSYYDKARKCISRLKANEIRTVNRKAYGRNSALSLIQGYESINDSKGQPTEYRAHIHEGLIHLFAGQTFTQHVWEIFRKLTPTARRLADYAASHQEPYPLPLKSFLLMCGSQNSSLSSARQETAKACSEIESSGRICKKVWLDTTDDKIYFQR
jgi:hypothetical protein